MAPITYKGLRKPTDPIYEQVSIVIGPASKQPTAESSTEEKSPRKEAGDSPSQTDSSPSDSSEASEK